MPPVAMSPHEAADSLHRGLGGAWTLQALNTSNFCDT
ncbi:hypothetical protein THIX_10080 [Thiomonas sp. X19]|nr:hypothetical protein THIX_10080 [Thiomonas sp. X19]